MTSVRVFPVFLGSKIADEVEVGAAEAGDGAVDAGRGDERVGAGAEDAQRRARRARLGEGGAERVEGRGDAEARRGGAGAIGGQEQHGRRLRRGPHGGEARGERIHVARADDEHEVALADRRGEVVERVVERLGEDRHRDRRNAFRRVGGGRRAERRVEVGRGAAGDRGLGGGVDGAEHEVVDPAEGGREVLEEGARARVAVRLEDGDDAPVRDAARGGDEGADLARVVRVVRDDGEALRRADALEAARGERRGALQRGDRALRRDARLGRRGDRGGGVERVVAARDREA